MGGVKLQDVSLCATLQNEYFALLTTVFTAQGLIIIECECAVGLPIGVCESKIQLNP